MKYQFERYSFMMLCRINRGVIIGVVSGVVMDVVEWLRVVVEAERETLTISYDHTRRCDGVEVSLISFFE